MTRLEDDLRLAFRAKASEITPPPPPLELQPQPVLDPAARRGGGGLGTPQQRRWIVPLAAAAAVLAVVASALAVASAHPAHRTTVLPPTTPIQASIPPYYVALTSVRPMTVRKPQAWPVMTTATVRATSTGALLADIVPPKPYKQFVFVSAAADDRYFVLAAQYGNAGFEFDHDGFFLLHIDPTAADPAARTTLTPFPAAALSGLQAMALSPDGRLLATMAQHFDKQKDGHKGPVMTTTELRVYNLVTGQWRTWTGGNVQQIYVIAGSGGLSWRQDGRFLVVPWNGSQLRLLNVTAQGHSVARDSTPLPAPRVPCSGFCLTYMTPDGKTVFAVYPTGRVPYSAPLFYNLVRFSVQTGTLTRINKLIVSGQGSRYTGYNMGSVVGPDDVLWTSDDGSKAIVAEVKPGTPNAGVYTGSHYTPIPWPANIVGAAW